MQSRELGETPAPCDHCLDHSACCTAAHPVALCALQGSGLLPSWREPTMLARCAWGANWTVLRRCAADSALSKQQRRQFSATAARAEYRIHPQPRRKSCNGLSLYGFCDDATAYAVGSSQAVKASAVGCVVAAIVGVLGVGAIPRADGAPF